MGYIIRYHSGTSSGQQQKDVSSPSTRFADLTHLTKNTNYTITVLASNGKGNGPASDPIVVATSDGSVFQCPLESGDFWFKDPNSCFRFYRCYNDGKAVQHENCSAGTEFKPSVNGSYNNCDHPSEPYCHV
ncbi:uncharacterized protein LOC110041302 [Orbicella faveolata]|uniref:uncharacterized protein LOC110041302 n=1 Tax=Orbicella faveolata TaxID=48498 RepID=UPI0009E297AF|nr:uncharacterized protein LOC110041302 [Orbicella faveolata]